MAASALDLLLRLSLAGGLAVLAALLVRRPVRALFGAHAVCLAWLLVPAVLVAAAVPPVQLRQEVVPLASALDFSGMAAPAAVAVDWSLPLLAAWLCGALLCFARMAHAQRRYVAGLGTLQRRGPVWLASTSAQGPALLGFFAPKIVLPADFHCRYDASEQALVIAHEQCHAQRRDPLANACAALLQCAFWFNPLMHVAASRYRFDRELACDAAVMARHPGRAKVYAAAMLKTQDGGAAALSACHWQSSHPLKERILQLKKPVPSVLRREAGRLLAFALAFAGATGAVMANADPSPAGPLKYAVSLTVEGGGHNARPVLHVRDGEEFKVTTSRTMTGEPDSTISSDMKVKAASAESVSVDLKLMHNDDTLAEPKLLLKLGETGAVQVGARNGESYKMTIKVVPLAGGAGA